MLPSWHVVGSRIGRGNDEPQSGMLEYLRIRMETIMMISVHSRLCSILLDIESLRFR